MMLIVRMVLYFCFAALSGHGIGVFVSDTGMYSISADTVASVLTGILGFAVTFVVSRFAKHK